VRIVAAQANYAVNQGSEIVAVFVRNEVVHVAREGSNVGMRALGVIAPSFASKVGGELHEAGAAPGIAMTTR